ncbi:MAG TPA: radical SAM protein [Candidatus Polarisedimenticolaceae bacterium]|nr:radical SAM protein [Candidatus Polarisedimenticolaceae bacterium]
MKTVDVILTSRCDLKCGYCFQDDKKAKSMEWETAQAALDLALGSSEPRVQIVFFGGEPMLEFDTIRRAVDYLKARRKPTQRVQLSLLTNGMSMTSEAIEFLSSNAFDVQLSFDGVPQMQIFRGKGTHRVLDALLDEMRERAGPWYEDHVSIAMTLVPRTIPWFADSVEYFLAKDVPELGVSAKVTPDPYFKPEMIEDLRAQFRRVFRASVRHYARTGRVPLVAFRKSGRARRVPRPKRITMCGVMRGERLAVDVDGQTNGCLMFAESYQSFPSPGLRERLAPLRLGDVRTPEVSQRLPMFPDAVRAAGLFHDKQSKRSTYGKCAECRYLARCSLCPMSIGYANGGSDLTTVPDFLCAYNLVSLSYRDRFPLSRPPWEGQ